MTSLQTPGLLVAGRVSWSIRQDSTTGSHCFIRPGRGPGLMSRITLDLSR